MAVELEKQKNYTTCQEKEQRKREKQRERGERKREGGGRGGEGGDRKGGGEGGEGEGGRGKGRGERESVEEYRGITLMHTAYKIYMMDLHDGERIREETKRNRIILPNQIDFRKEMGTIDNIYVLYYLINNELERKKEKMMALFIHIKAAFDTVDRRILIESIRDTEE